MFYNILRFLFGWLVRLLFPTKVFGPRKFEKKGMVMAMNHLAAFDPILLCAYFKPHPNFWAKKEIFKNRLVSWFFKKMGAVKIDRSGQDVIAIKEALTKLKNNKLFALFPEGTRNHDNPERMQTLRRGIAMLSIRSKSPVRLLYMSNKPRLFRKNYIIVSEEFTLEEFYGQKTTSDVLDKAMEIIGERFSLLQQELNEILVKRGVTVRS